MSNKSMDLITKIEDMDARGMRQAIQGLLNQLSQTHQLSYTVQAAADTLQDNRILNNALKECIFHLKHQSTYQTMPAPGGEDLRAVRLILVGFVYQIKSLIAGCFSGVPLLTDGCPHGCHLNNERSVSRCKALRMLEMCGADLTAFCAVSYHIRIINGLVVVALGNIRNANGLLEVFSEKIRTTGRSILVVADDNVCFDARLGQGLHYIDIERFANRTVFRLEPFYQAVKDNWGLELAGLSYMKLLSDLQSLAGLEGPLGGSILCSYFKGRKCSWSSMFVAVSDFCRESNNDQIQVRDNDGHLLTILLANGHVSIDHQDIKLTLPGSLAAAVVESWTFENNAVHISCLHDRHNIAASLSKLGWMYNDNDYDILMFLSSAVAVLEQKKEAQMALRDLKLYENAVRKMASMGNGDHEVFSDAWIEEHADMPKVERNEWYELAILLEDYEEPSASDEVNFLTFGEWGRDIALVKSPGMEVSGMKIVPKEGWFPAECFRKRIQCHSMNSVGSLSVRDERVRLTKVPKFLAGTVHFAKRVTGLGLAGALQLELGEYNADEGHESAGVLDLAISGQLGDSSALWALEAIYMGKICISSDSPSTIKNCARQFSDNGYCLEAVMPARIFNKVAVVTDGRDVYAVLGTGFRCVKVVKRNEMRYELERATIGNIDGLERGVLCGGRTVG